MTRALRNDAIHKSNFCSRFSIIKTQREKWKFLNFWAFFLFAKESRFGHGERNASKQRLLMTLILKGEFLFQELNSREFRYKGQWNEVARYPNNFQDEAGQCNRATYTERDDISVKVNNTQIIERDGVREANGAFGQAVQEIVSYPSSKISFNKL